MNAAAEIRRIADQTPMIVARHGPIHRIRRMFETRDVGIFHSEIAPGSELPREVHKFIEIIYRIKGETVTVIDGHEYVSRPGSYLVVPAGQWHHTRVLDQHEPVSQIIVATYNQVPGSVLSMVEAMLAGTGADGLMQSASDAAATQITGGAAKLRH